MANYGAKVDITATSFTPGSLSVREVVGTVLAEFQHKQGPKAVALYERTTRTWNDPPGFESHFKFSGGEAVLWTVITGTDLEIWKWIWLDEGTSVRHAILSDNWQSKTQPGFLDARGGQGHVVAVNKNYLGKGIDPREFAEQIAKEMEKTFADDIQAAVDRGLDIADAKGKGEKIVSK